MNKTDMIANQLTPIQPEGLHIPKSLTKEAIRDKVEKIISKIEAEAESQFSKSEIQNAIGFRVCAEFVYDVISNEFEDILSDE